MFQYAIEFNPEYNSGIFLSKLVLIIVIYLNVDNDYPETTSGKNCFAIHEAGFRRGGSRTGFFRDPKSRDYREITILDYDS